MVWFLLALVPVVAIAYVIWAYRRKFSAKEAASRKRVALLLGESRAEPAASGNTVPAGATGMPGTVPAAAVPVPAWTARERFLSQPETLLYYLLRVGLPDHEIFAHVSLAALVAVGQRTNAYERDQQLRRVAQHEFSFVVCDKRMRVVAAVELTRAAAGPGQDLKVECLKAAGIRLVQVDPAALPRREELRTLVRGTQS